MMERAQLDELLFQALETEHGGIAVYETAIKCAVNEDLRSEWEEYLDQTRRHEQVMTDLLDGLGLDPATETPGRGVVRHIGESLVAAMEQALAAGPPDAAQLVAAECVLHAETRDHLNWELLRAAAEKAPKQVAEALTAACDEVEEEEDEHLYHTMGWVRELWMESLGLPAVLPPPEEQKNVKTAIGAARAKNAREDMTKSS
jgi:rubrerythrin